MRVRGTGRGLRTLSRFALIGVIGGGAAACSSDASRLGDPFGNPFASNMANEPTSTGSISTGELTPAPVVRTSRIQSQALGAPGVAMSPRPMAAAPPATPVQTSRVASMEPVSGMVSGMNPDAGRAMTTRSVPAAPVPKIDRAAERKAAEAAALAARKEAEAARKEAEAEKLAEARRLVEASKAAEKKAAEAKAEAKAMEARKLVEAKKLVESRRAEAAKAAAEAKLADAKKGHPRPGQAVAKAEDKPVRKIEIKEAKAETKAEAKPDPAKLKAEAAKLAEKKAAEAEAKAAKLEAAKAAAKQVAEAKAAEAAAKQAAEAAKAPVKVAAVEAPKAEPASTGSVAPDTSFRWPAKGRVISGYGSSGNEGINISVPEGTAVKAAEDGTVAYAGSDVKGYGKLVLVRHANGYVSAYAHNGELDVRPGEKVKRGQTIAKSGASGNVTSPQLHFEIRKGATPVDPMPHLASN
ncbi:murein hydrolase activator EnvC family protein [Methylobacterium gossipiicola]|uniref:Murein DD-endopeptidase MepM and murein hydrolase activator NlpD, contain LysM domain n=1 Tax=Methylobacterium gossipiicola TaxID=582675 RepID=A0A1I2W1D8_9HYPH|nr:M23 family metallopeptidase [Methylobacterium gossipiicola]SFG95245.1 Murein DD-endopeptidase MepM and murein hydrolase activator NlpD, contain LysM domain [Methylobacterium gossipiicola]